MSHVGRVTMSYQTTDRDFEDVDAPPEKLNEVLAQTIIEKKSAINLIEAFSCVLFVLFPLGQVR